MNEYSTVVGLDLGDTYSAFCVVSREGTVLEEGRVATTAEALRRKFGSFSRSRVALEAGTHSPWVSRLIGSFGHETLVAHARKLRLIYGNERKNDRLDASALARVARLDPQLLSPIEHRGAQAQADLAVIRSRDVLVRARTQLINHVRGTVKALGARVKGCSAASFHRQAPLGIPEVLGEALTPVLALIEQLSAQIAGYDRSLKALCAKYPQTQVFEEIGGVGPVLSLTYLLTLERAERFARSRDVAAYVGLVPKRRQSGERDPQLRITKSGNTHLRRLLVGSARYILGPFGPDCALRRWGLGLAGRGSRRARGRAAVAVARKLAVMLHRLWVTGECYDPQYGQRLAEQGGQP